MKKIVVILALGLMSFSTNEEKKLKVELTPQEWNVVFQVIDESNAPNLQVKAVRKVLLDQLQPQLDSIPKRK